MLLIASKVSERATATDTVRQTINGGVRRAHSLDAYTEVEQLVWWGRPFAMENFVFLATLFSSETD